MTQPRATLAVFLQGFPRGFPGPFPQPPDWTVGFTRKLRKRSHTRARARAGGPPIRVRSPPMSEEDMTPRQLGCHRHFAPAGSACPICSFSTTARHIPSAAFRFLREVYTQSHVFSFRQTREQARIFLWFVFFAQTRFSLRANRARKTSEEISSHLSVWQKSFFFAEKDAEKICGRTEKNVRFLQHKTRLYPAKNTLTMTEMFGVLKLDRLAPQLLPFAKRRMYLM